MGLWILVATLAAFTGYVVGPLSRRRSLAISGLVVCALVTAAGFILPFVFPTKSNHAEQVRSTGTAACFGFGRTPVIRALASLPAPTPAAVGGSDVALATGHFVYEFSAGCFSDS